MKKSFVAVTLKLTVCLVVCLVAMAGLFTDARAQDPRPYERIAIPLPDTLDQLYRDSATIKIGRVRVNQAGYRPNDAKWFYYVGRSGFSGGSFYVIDAETGNQVSTGTLINKNFNASGQLKIRASHHAYGNDPSGTERYRMQSDVVAGPLYEGNIGTSLASGRYRVRVGADTSAPFWVHDEVYSWVRDAAIKFPGINRCGNTDSWFHAACHLEDATPGGWHDCGDHLKEGVTQAYLHTMLGLAQAVFRDHDVDNYGRNHNNTRHTDGIPDVLYEAKHGSDYIIKSYDNANGNVSQMVTAIGLHGANGDHGGWMLPEDQENMPVNRGGNPRLARVELGTNVTAMFAAGLAFTAVNYATFDSAYAAKSITVAKALYDYAKSAPLENQQSDAYVRVPEVKDKMAMAALALLYATENATYLNDLIYNKSIGNSFQEWHDHTYFEGGWFSYNEMFGRSRANTSWGTVHMFVKWGFFRLILKDEELCNKLGISSDERLKLLGRTINQLIDDIGQMGYYGGITPAGQIQLPSNQTVNNATLAFDDVWKNMGIEQDWMWNRYQFGNIFDLFAYSDMAMWIEDNDIQLPGRTTATNWYGREVRELVIRQMDYMLGVNPWDISLIHGIGAKNHNHAHHRAANFEGKNIPGKFYPYRPPVGGLHSGTSPVTNALYDRIEQWKDHEITETGIDASATMIIPILGLAKPDPITDPPSATVRVIYVGYDEAIIEVRQTRFGMTTIRYAEESATTFTNKAADSNGMYHRITLTGLKGGTVYNFDALVTDMFGNSTVIKNDRGELFSFKTLTERPGEAEIMNVKVCKVTADSAEIFWYTPNGNYDSRVVYGTSRPVTLSNGTVVDGNIYGRPSQFHYVKIGGLKEKTTYYFYVENNGTRDDNGGQFYTFTTPVMHVAFDVRLIKYADDFFGLNIVNQDVKAYDSLELRIYVRMPDTINTGIPDMPRRAFADHIGLRVDIGIKYRSDGYQDTHFKQEVDDFVQRARPVRIEDTYNPVDNTWAFYIPVPMGAAEMQSGARFRLDLMFDTRSHNHPYEDLMDVKPPADILNRIWSGWSFSAHRRDNGDPVDYPGIPSGSKTDVDDIYHITPINNYVTIYRKNEFVWGYSPSASEMLDKKTHYSMTSQVTSPLFNPSEEYLFMEQVVPTITVNAWAKVTDENGNPGGEVNDIWINGVRVRDVSSVAVYDRSSDIWNLTLPVPVKNGGNNIDITIFGGPSADCAECYGCAFANHSFYLEFRGADPYPSTLKLLESRDINSAEVRDSAVIDFTTFYIYVDDENGNLNKDAPDTLYVTVVNLARRDTDSLYVRLIETGNETGKFMSEIPVNVIDYSKDPSRPGDIRMDGGQTIWITYIDPTDPEDVSRTSLATRAEFPVASDAWFMDRLGVGDIDRVSVRFSRDLTRLPDSLHLTVPGMGGVIRVGVSDITFDDNSESLIHFRVAPAIAGVTGFRTGSMTARTFLRYGSANTLRESVIEVRDSAGPVLLERALLMERQSGSLDTVQIWFSEPMTRAGFIGSTIVLRRNGTDDRVLTVNEVIDSSVNVNSFTLLIDPAGNAIREFDSLYINALGPTRDRVGNRAHTQNKPVPVELKSVAPRVMGGAYYDMDANGKIDRVELSFSKPMELTGLRLWLSWENGEDVPVDWSLLSSADGTDMSVTANIEGMNLMGDDVVTSGSLRATVRHNAYPTDTLRYNLADRAAPVVKSARYYPSADENVRGDTLHVTFSEPLGVAQVQRPFKFLYTENGTVYSMTMQNMREASSIQATHSFLIEDIEGGIEYPGEGDSIWINTEVRVADTSGNLQNNVNNRKVRMTFKPAPLTFDIIVAPNPFVPGRIGANGKHARIIVSPRLARTEVSIKGTVSFYDKLGNLVLTDDLKRDPDSRDLYYEWDGNNKHGRRAGSGTYVAIVAVEYAQDDIVEKVPPVKEKKLIYLVR